MSAHHVCLTTIDTSIFVIEDLIACAKAPKVGHVVEFNLYNVSFIPTYLRDVIEVKLDLYHPFFVLDYVPFELEVEDTWLKIIKIIEPKLMNLKICNRISKPERVIAAADHHNSHHLFVELFTEQLLGEHHVLVKVYIKEEALVNI